MKHFLMTVLTAILLMAVFSGSASAVAISDIQTTVDWADLSINPDFAYPTGGYTGMDSNGWINMGASETGEIHIVGNYLSNSIGANYSELENDEDMLMAHSHSSSSGDLDTSGWINGNIHRSFEFSVLSGGSYSFSLGYTVESQLSREDNSESAINDWLFDLQIRSANDGWEIVASKRIDGKHDINNTDDLLLDISGIIALDSVALCTDNIYSFGIQQGVASYTESSFIGDSNPVPEPATMLLLGSGLLGLAGFRRKFTKS